LKLLSGLVAYAAPELERTMDVIWVDMGEQRALGIPAARCAWDSERTAAWESFGPHRFAWLPRRCRNGKVRWLTTLERHRDGSYTLGRLN
jgi:hypothetical protein